MVNINKKTPPQSLIDYKRQQKIHDKDLVGKDIFDDFKEKSDLRTSLIEEQGYICAYCMQKIENDPLKCKIEHCISQDESSKKKLDYDNLLLCCKGNEGHKPVDQHCDTKKGEKSFHFNPSEQKYDMERLIQYNSQGKILSTDAELNDQLVQTLNLNFKMLKMHRLGVLQEIERVLSKKKGTRTKSEIQKLINRWEALGSKGQHKPFYGVAVYKLKKHQSYCRA
ncbi:MAG: hypothetical protein B6241_08620 [Spirochaetaceae bacterium 4572_59]|nr:MAG: hypothetical protein B6241_08620 [Spirochaetaceae bacterium 4572_59]